MSNVTEPEVYLQRWFNNAKREEIKRDNLKDFIRWAFFNDNQTDGQTEEIEIYTAQMEKLLKRELPLGKGSAEHMGRKHETDDGEIGVIALEIMPVSSRITHPALSKDDMVSEIHSIVEHHRWGRFVLVSHSYGSIIATHIIKSPVTATLAGPLVFIDPICFLLHLPEVTYNFLVRKPVHANEHQLYYFASSDIGVADTLAKHFCWSESILWKKDLMIEEQGIWQSQRDTIVVLSGRDLIVDTQAVRKYLLNSLVSRKMVTNGEKALIGRPEAPNVQMRAGQWKPPRIEVIWYGMLDHAQVFDNQETRKPIVTAIKKYAAKYRVPRG
ncbi:hypothetical protein ETB97_011419 [Aspergillus alliaceus]|uniref:AB hydrolase-1 domain-containing protein n=1 Tax=Petromyces alliaceus TaxID=209559 RepID=A0A8H6EBD2_PETAA|nr:hypothetical protein ETB97_011419 [Aspergillus burnettii]